MPKIDTETVRATAAAQRAQRAQRNVRALHLVASAPPKPKFSCCGQPMSLDEQILHAIFGTCPPEAS